jgi:hypothetical protein
MINTDTITIYWSPANFTNQDKSWTMLYSSPESLASNLRSLRYKDASSSSMYACPASKDALDKVYFFSSAVDDFLDLPEETLNKFYSLSKEEIPVGTGLHFPTPDNSLSLLNVPRSPSLEGHINLSYNLTWTFIADEPLVAKFTAPYFPPISPAPGVILSAGKFDIGSWLRPFNLDYHVPITTRRLEFKEGDPLFYIECFTDKNIVFKRYINTPFLSSLINETVESINLYGTFKSLSQRYRQAKNTRIIDQALTEIRKNLLD